MYIIKSVIRQRFSFFDFMGLCFEDEGGIVPQAFKQ